MCLHQLKFILVLCLSNLAYLFNINCPGRIELFL